jgi:hypothetical protein
MERPLLAKSCRYDIWERPRYTNSSGQHNYMRRVIMQQVEKLKFLTVALYAFGTIFIIGVPAMMMWIWPSGRGWTPAQPSVAN